MSRLPALLIAFLAAPAFAQEPLPSPARVFPAPARAVALEGKAAGFRWVIKFEWVLESTGSPTGPVTPPPIDPPPPPKADPLAQEIAAAWANDAGKEQARAYAAFLRQMVGVIQGTQPPALMANFFDVYVTGRKQAVGDNLPAVRRVVGREMDRFLPGQLSATFSPELRRQTADLFARVATTLEGLR